MNVCLQEFFQFSQAILDSRYKIIHATQILIFVSVQQVLELRVEDLQVFLDEHLLALPGELILRALVKVHLDPALLLQQTSLRLFIYSVTGFCCKNSVLSLV